MTNTSENIATVKFDKTKADEQKQNNDSSPVEGTAKESDTVIDDKNKVFEEDNDRPYLDHRTVTISLVKSNSLYRKVNDKSIPKRKDYIGSSFESSYNLCTNNEELEKYFPNLIGISATDKDFIKRVKQYLNNIKVPVDELGKTLDISFNYNRKSDYNRIIKEEEKIEEEYQKANKQDIASLKKALKIKINKINSLESQKYKYGNPINIDDYILYRHCLLYNDVAKDKAIINSSQSIRFYFRDDKKEYDKLVKTRQQVLVAKSNFIECVKDPTLFEAVYIQYCVYNNMPIISALAEDKVIKEINLDKFSIEDPVRFNRFFSNKDIKIMATIEKLIARGELIRNQYSQNITSIDGEFIGANMKEAVAWFNSPENNSVVTAYINKLKNI